MCKVRALRDTPRPGYNELYSAKTGTDVDGVGTGTDMNGIVTSARVDSTETMDDDGPEEIEGEVDIRAREKQTDADIEIYYISKQEQNPNHTRQDK